MNFAAIDELKRRHQMWNSFDRAAAITAATFSPELVDFSIYVIDVAQGRNSAQRRTRDD
ncbi:urease accessory protein UreG [Bacillus megaterium]|nr:urease accessory protein UreG [Priestia megaterium]